MSPEQIARARAARAAATAADEGAKLLRSQRTRRVVTVARNGALKFGDLTRAIPLGRAARARAERVVDGAIGGGEVMSEEGEDEEKREETKKDKLVASGALAARSLVRALVGAWEGKVVPTVREVLPVGIVAADGEKGEGEEDLFGSRALASVVLGVFLSVVLFPAVFIGGGGDKPKVKVTDGAGKKMDAQTAMLEKKLKRERASLNSSYVSRSSAQRSVFPPDDGAEGGRDTTLQKSKTITSGDGVDRNVTSTDVRRSVPNVESPSGVVPSLPKSMEIAKAPEVVNAADVTSSMVMTSMTKALGVKANILSSASFDILSPEPTIVLEVSKSYHNLPTLEQKKIAQTMLKSARTLGYERVQLIEQGSNMEVAHAGIDVDLEDEAQNLRVELRAVREQSNKLAVKSSTSDAEIEALKVRMAEERDEYSARRDSLERSITGLRGENGALLEDLAEAKAEISKMPDRIALEERTLEAEKRSEKMGDTVEMLSAQLSKARVEEAQAKQVEVESIEAGKRAEREKEEALKSVNGRIESAQREADRRSNESIEIAQKEARASVEESERKVKSLEERMAIAEQQALKTLETTTTTYEKQLDEEKSGREKEIVAVEKKYEVLLEDVQRKAKAELETFQREADNKMKVAMKEGKEFANGITKERDEALRNSEKIAAKAEKAANKASREKDKLQAKVGKLEAKLKGKGSSTVEQSSATNMNEESAVGNDQ